MSARRAARRGALGAGVLLGVALAGCQGAVGRPAAADPAARAVLASAARATSDGTDAVPAVLDGASDAASRAALQAALQQLLGPRRITLAPDAFVDSNELVLERERPPGDAGRLATGRETASPIRLRLLRDDGGCWLELSAAEPRRVVVPGLRCRPVVGAAGADTPR